jgi:predicted nucleotidyltransferase
VHDWPGRNGAEQLRLWPAFDELVARIDARRALFDGAILMGSLVEGRGDDLSDVDLLAVVPDGQFADAWAARRELSGGALYAWDHVEGEDREVKGHKWLTRDLVKIECLIATPSSGTRLAEPVAVVVGDPSLPDRFERTGPIPRETLEEYAQGLRDTGQVHEVEARYGELKAALRRLRG